MSEKQDRSIRKHEQDDTEQKKHYESWDSFWGRPGYGAPRYVDNDGDEYDDDDDHHNVDDNNDDDDDDSDDDHDHDHDHDNNGDDDDDNDDEDDDDDLGDSKGKTTRRTL